MIDARSLRNSKPGQGGGRIGILRTRLADQGRRPGQRPGASALPTPRSGLAWDRRVRLRACAWSPAFAKEAAVLISFETATGLLSSLSLRQAVFSKRVIPTKITAP